MTGDRVAQIERACTCEPVTDQAPKCWRCGRTLAEYLTRPWSIRCRTCKAQNKSEP